MSLLLEALKKAELAKQGKQTTEGDARADEIEFESAAPTPDSASQQPSQGVITRGQLPDISQPLEILSEDLPSERREPEAMQLEPTTPTAPRSEPQRAEPPLRATREPELEPQAESRSAAATEPTADSFGAEDREAARQLFEAKEVAYNPKRNFYITIGVLLTAGAGYAGYVWWQLQPRSSYNLAAVQNAPKGPPPAPIKPISTPPQEPTAEPAVAASPPPAPPPAEPARAATVAAAPAATAARPAPTTEATPAPSDPVFARTGTKGLPTAVGDQSSDRAPARSPAPEREQERREVSPIAIAPQARVIDPSVVRGFDAYQRNDLADARESYQQALQRDPFNRDALLGIAAIDVRERHFDRAQAGYIKLLELDPRDVNAAAGLMALRGQVNPGLTESQLKTMLATNPDAAVLYFTLGNQYAQQSRWTEAQAAYFKAYTGEPENADFAVNLAISLDHLRKNAMALRYYRRAIELAANHTVSFNPNQVRTRIQELE